MEPETLLDKAVQAMQNQPVPAGPAPEVVARVLAAGAAPDLAQAASALAAAPVPGGPPAELDARVLALLQQHEADPTVSLTQTIPPTFRFRSLLMNRRFRFASGLAAMLVVGLTLAMLLVPAASAIAQVAEALKNIHSAKYKMIVQPGAQQPQTMEAMFLAPGKIRTVMGEGVVMIQDFENGKVLTLDPAHKKAITADFAKPGKGPIDANVFEQMRQGVIAAAAKGPGAAESSGEKVLDGKKVVGYRIEIGPGPRWQVWADPKTHLPVRVEWEAFNVAVAMVMTDIEYNPELDAALFSVDVPEGYAEQKLPRSATEAATEQHLVDFLDFYALHADGEFPVSLSPDVVGKGLQAALAKHPPAKPWGQEQTMELTMKVTRSFLFVQFLPPDADWHYAGKGVKKGEAGKVIFWYKQPNRGVARIGYGDLTVKEVPIGELDKLVPATQPAN